MNLRQTFLTMLFVGSASAAAASTSLCGVTDEAVLRVMLAGEWQGEVTSSLETELLSVTRPVSPGVSELGVDGTFSIDFFEGLVGEGETLSMSLGETLYDVDGVDDLLATTETEWMADELSLTPCGPEELPQFSAQIDYAPDLNGTAVLIPYFDDQILMFFEMELRQDGVLAFITNAALLTPAQRGPLKETSPRQ